MSERRPLKQNEITHGVIWKQLLVFFFPILLGTFFQQLYNAADASIVGKGVGKAALAAVGGTTGSLINLLVGFFVGLASGATVVISQHYGAEDSENVEKSVHTAAAMALLFGLLLTGIGLFLTDWMLRAMSTPEDVLPYAGTYLRIIFAGMVPSVIYNVGTGVLRALGDSRRPLYYLIAASLTNIALDVLLVLVLRMGVAGAGWATVLSQTLSAVLVVRSLCRREDSSRLVLRRIRLDRQQLRRIVQIGLPAGLQSVMYSISNVIIQRAVNGFDTDVLAGWTAYGKLDGMFWMVVGAFGISVTTFVGQNYGAGLMPRVKKSVRVCMAMTVGATVVLAGLLYFFGGELYKLFTDDPAVIREGVHMLHLLVPFYIAYIPIEILSGALRGAGDTLVPTLLTLVFICLFRVIWIMFVAPHFAGVDVILWSYPVTWVLTGGLFILYYRNKRWSPIK